MTHGTDGGIHIRTNKGTYFDGGTLMTQGWAGYLGNPGQGRLYFADFGGESTSSFLDEPLFATADGFAGLAIARFLIGTGFAGAVTSIMLLAMHWAPPERYASVAATVMASMTGRGMVSMGASYLE